MGKLRSRRPQGFVLGTGSSLAPVQYFSCRAHQGNHFSQITWHWYLEKVSDFCTRSSEVITFARKKSRESLLTKGSLKDALKLGLSSNLFSMTSLNYLAQNIFYFQTSLSNFHLLQAHKTLSCLPGHYSSNLIIKWWISKDELFKCQRDEAGKEWKHLSNLQ